MTNSLAIYRGHVWTDTGKPGGPAFTWRQMCRPAPDHDGQGRARVRSVGIPRLHSARCFVLYLLVHTGAGLNRPRPFSHSCIARYRFLPGGLSDRRSVRPLPYGRGATVSRRSHSSRHLNFGHHVLQDTLDVPERHASGPLWLVASDVKQPSGRKISHEQEPVASGARSV